MSVLAKQDVSTVLSSSTSAHSKDSTNFGLSSSSIGENKTTTGSNESTNLANGGGSGGSNDGLPSSSLFNSMLSTKECMANLIDEIETLSKYISY